MIRSVHVSEAQWQAKVIDIAHVYGWLVHHTRPARTANGWRTPVAADGVGFPDLVIVRDGVVICAELKSDTGRVQPAQERWLAALGPHGRLWRPRDEAGLIDELRRR